MSGAGPSLPICQTIIVIVDIFNMHNTAVLYRDSGTGLPKRGFFKGDIFNRHNTAVLYRDWQKRGFFKGDMIDLEKKYRHLEIAF